MPQYIQHPSFVTQWRDGTLQPLPEAVASTETVWFALPPGPDTEETWEGLLARREENGELTILAIPMYLYDLNFGDRVTAIESAEGPYVATGIAHDAGAYTFRVFITSEAPDAWHVLSAELAESGCLVDVMSEKFVAYSCPAELSQTVAGRLFQLQEAGLLEYETGRTTLPGEYPHRISS